MAPVHGKHPASCRPETDDAATDVLPPALRECGACTGSRLSMMSNAAPEGLLRSNAVASTRVVLWPGTASMPEAAAALVPLGEDGNADVVDADAAVSIRCRLADGLPPMLSSATTASVLASEASIL